MAGAELPIVCTLSPNNMIDRLREFEKLFAQGLTGLDRQPLLLRLTFNADQAQEAEIRDLCAREKECCAFLKFDFERTERDLVVQVTAPENAGPTLDGLQKLAEQNVTPEVVAEEWTA